MTNDHPTPRCAPLSGRALIAVTGPDRSRFLQGLVTQDIRRVERDGIGYGALLTPQGKLVADFLMVAQEGRILIDTDASAADDLLRRLAMFKLRSAVGIERLDMAVTAGLGPAPEGALPDPRHAGLGWRLYGAAIAQGTAPDWDAVHVALGVPRFGAELVAGDSFILELGFEALNGVDFRKGCYVGQEVTARMHHKTDLRRALVRVGLSEPVAPGTAITLADGREAGAVYSQSGGAGLALMRKDRMEGTLKAGPATVTIP